MYLFMNYNKKINFKFLEYLYQRCDSKNLHEMHLKNVLNGKEEIINDIDIYILRGKEVLEYIIFNYIFIYFDFFINIIIIYFYNII